MLAPAVATTVNVSRCYQMPFEGKLTPLRTPVLNPWRHVSKPPLPYTLSIITAPPEMPSRCSGSGWHALPKGSFSHQVSAAPQVQCEDTFLARNALSTDPFPLASPCVIGKTSGVLECRFSCFSWERHAEKAGKGQVVADTGSHLVR